MNIVATKISIPGLSPSEQAYKLTGDYLVAISVIPGKNCAPDTFAWCARGRAINTDGSPELDHDGNPIVVEHHVSCPKHALISGGANSKGVAAQAIKELIEGGDGIAAHIAASRAYKAGV